MWAQRRWASVNKTELALPGMPRAEAKVATPLSEAPRLIAVLVGLGALLSFFVFQGDTFVINILAYSFLLAGVATAWNIIGGFGGQFSLAHGVFFAVGAYLTAKLFLVAGVSPW